jgi:hypothetical protein
MYMYVINGVSQKAYIGWCIDCKKISSTNTVKLGKNQVLVQYLYRPSVLLRGWVILVNGGRYSGKSMSILVHKLFNTSLGLEPTSLNPAQDMQIVLLSISHRALCPLAANHFFADRKCAYLLKTRVQTTVVGNVPVLVLCSGSFGFLV